MKLSRIRTIDIIALVIFIVICGFVFDYGKFAIRMGEIKGCERTLKGYVYQNNGRLPTQKSELDILAEKYSPIQKYEIKLNVNIDNIKERDGKLYDKTTGEQIFIIDGKFHEKFEWLYEDTSFEVYREMLKYHCLSLPKIKSGSVER